jgi:hypothetical protein
VSRSRTYPRKQPSAKLQLLCHLLRVAPRALTLVAFVQSLISQRFKRQLITVAPAASVRVEVER